MGLFLSLFVCLASSHQLLGTAANDTLAVGESISVNQTIVSPGGVFALGFFSPGDSNAALYAGIWYNSIPGRKTVVWVANREAPLRDPSGVLSVTGDGNLAVLDGRGRALWSTNASGGATSAAALQDSGNLVLQRRGEKGRRVVLWQSFDHPTDTLLPTMEVQVNFTSGEGTRLTAWNGAADPSPGEFSLTVHPERPFQAYVMKGEVVYWRGRTWSDSPVLTLWLGGKTSVYVETVYADAERYYWKYTVTESTLLARFVLDPAGSYAFLYWDDTRQRWNSMGSMPRDACDLYNWCGASAVCDRRGGAPACRCLEGYEIRNRGEWEAGNHTGGCVRRRPAGCGGGFGKVGGMRLPDGFEFVRGKTAEECAAVCEGDCRCRGYASTANGNSSRGSSEVGSRCFVWRRELLDAEYDSVFAEDFYTRMDTAAAGNRNASLKILLPTLCVGILLIGLFCYTVTKIIRSRVRKRGTRKAMRLEDINFSDVPGSEKDVSEVPFLDFKSVKAATGNFSDSNKLGEGGFGPVYKGLLLNGHELAVKRLSKGSGQGYQEFANEVRLIAKLQHKNLVRLLGWCTHKDEKILIYEYMPNQSLDTFIFEPTRSLKLHWDRRFRIIEGIADGLLYLHQYSRLRVIHRDLKTSNILLDGAMNPKISDFGLARIFDRNQTEANTGKVVGTYGYMSPEYASDGLFSEKSDVFSFGVMVLELITGKRSTGFYPYRNSLSLLEYAWQMWEEGSGLELRDPAMGNSFQAAQLLKCVQLGLLCIQEDAAERPTMSSLVSMLSNENSTLPMPKQPAFAIARYPHRVIGLSTQRSTRVSINELTTSSVEGR